MSIFAGQERDLSPPGGLAQRGGHGSGDAFHAEIAVIINSGQIPRQQRGRPGRGQGDVVDHLLGAEDADGTVPGRALKHVQQIGELAHAEPDDVDAEARLLLGLVLNSHACLLIADSEEFAHGLTCIDELILRVADEFSGILHGIDHSLANVLPDAADGVPVLVDGYPTLATWQTVPAGGGRKQPTPQAPCPRWPVRP